MLNFVACFSCIEYKDNKVIFIIHSVNVIYYIFGLVCAQLSLYLWDETSLTMMDDLFDTLLNSFPSILLRIFAPMFTRGIGLVFCLFLLFLLCLLRINGVNSLSFLNTSYTAMFQVVSLKDQYVTEG